MKAVYLSVTGQLGGGERNLLDILSGVRSAEPGWSLELIAGSDGPLASKARALGVRSEVLPFPRSLESLGDAAAGGPAGQGVNRLDLLKNCLLASPAILAYTARLRRLLAQSSPDVVQSSGFKMHLLGSWARPKRAAMVWHVQDYVRPRPFMATLLRRHAHMCTAAVTNSRSVAHDLTLNCGRHLKAYTVYNGIDLSRFSVCGPGADLDALSGLPPAGPRTIRVGLVATFSRWKGHLVFLRALAALPKHLSVRGYIVGGNIYQTVGSHFSLEELQREAARLDLGGRVGFTGFVEDTASVMRSLDIVAHTSTEPEPFGLVIAEAMACGRPVIVAESGGAAEIVSVGANALAHRPGDVEHLAEQIRVLAADSKLRTRLGLAGRSTAERSFDRGRMVSDLIPIYREICSRPDGREKVRRKPGEPAPVSAK
ncbi:MAG TPA: glycosyltransferase family 4 protein [Bryobacteraceae bacterium]